MRQILDLSHTISNFRHIIFRNIMPRDYHVTNTTKLYESNVLCLSLKNIQLSDMRPPGQRVDPFHRYHVDCSRLP